jgi:broad specificity phosphatase PhoE
VTIILLARHGQSDWNATRRWQGHADRPLTEKGRAQARALAERLAHIELDAVYSSDLRRAAETARVVADAQGLELVQLPELREVDVGSWSGLTTAEVEKRFPDGFNHWAETRAGGWTDGETYEELGARVVRDLRALAERHPNETVLAVTHGGPIRSVLAAAAGLSFTSGRVAIGFVENCQVVRVAIREEEIEAVH